MKYQDMPHDFTGLKSIHLPVHLAPLEGKYYGTTILDSNGEEIVRIWTATGSPSIREKESYGSNWTLESWSEDCCDSHWECEQDLERAKWLVQALNLAMVPRYRGGDAWDRYAITRFSIGLHYDEDR